MPYLSLHAQGRVLPFGEYYVTLCLMSQDIERKDLFPGALEVMVLRTLQRGPLHGYALAQQIKRNSNDLLEIEEGSLYPALQRMLKGGWLEANWGTSSTGRRVRIYQITAAGAKHLDRQVTSFERMLEGIRLVLQPE